MKNLSNPLNKYLVVERVYEDGELRRQRRVTTAADFAEGAEKIARLEKFRSVQDWRDVAYSLESPSAARETT